MRINFTILAVLLALPFISAQKINITIGEVQHYDPYFENNAERIYRLAVDQVVANGRFTLLERKHFDAIELEMERQKNESFIDGEIAEQGKHIGANLLYNLEFNRNEKVLITRLLDIESGGTVCSKSYDFKAYQEVYTLQDDFIASFQRDLEDCFAGLSTETTIELAEVLDVKGTKATKLLFYCEGDCNVLQKDTLKVYYKTTKKVSDREAYFEEVIGSVRVDEIENQNFFNAVVLEGNKQILSISKKKIPLYAKIKR